jgi:hypothetical protein
MKFPAKYSKIRSYVDFSASVGHFRLDGGAKRTFRDDDLQEDF